MRFQKRKIILDFFEVEHNHEVGNIKINGGFRCREMVLLIAGMGLIIILRQNYLIDEEGEKLVIDNRIVITVDDTEIKVKLSK